MDMGYDLTPVYEGFEEHVPSDHPAAETPAVKAGKQRPPVCEHGQWTFAGSDAKPGLQVALPNRRLPSPAGVAPWRPRSRPGR
jgi:hypothetical protein